MRNNKKKGFTVVELVIVIAVIGILSAVLIPTFAGLVSKANESALQQNLTNAYTTYASEYSVSSGEELYSKAQVYFVESEEALKEVDGKVTISGTVYALNSNGTFVEVKNATSIEYMAIALKDTTTGEVKTYNGFYGLVKYKAPTV